MSLQDKRSQLTALAAEITAHNTAPQLAASATQLVMGTGNPDATIVLIGEAPGKSEDEQGKPFVGVSGTFLDAMLERAGLVRDDVYITNIVKYRPPNNRDPTTEEKQVFTPYLQRELAIVDPDIIIPLGRHSMEYFLPNAKISEAHGRLFDVEVDGLSRRVAPLYHPAAALYNGSLRQTLIDDFERIGRIVTSGSTPRNVQVHIHREHS